MRMTRLLSVLGLIAFLLLPTVGTATQGAATPVPVSDGDVFSGPAIGDTVTYVDDNGNGAANITVEEVMRGWQGHDDDEPEGGYEYVAAVITIESTIARGSFGVGPGNFRLQDEAGFMWDYADVTVQEDLPVLPLEDVVQLANGESATFLVVYEVLAGQPLDHLFWSLDSDRLLTLASVADV